MWLLSLLLTATLLSACSGNREKIVREDVHIIAETADGEMACDGAVYAAGDYEYMELGDDSVLLLHYVGSRSRGRLKIPSHLGGKPVTAIQQRAFKDCAGLKSVTIPNTVTSIGEEAFRDCDNLSGIDLPDSVTHIGRNAFESCRRMKSVKLSRGLTTIAPYAFYDCKALTKIDIPDGVVSIDKAAFEGCRFLISVTLPDSVTAIGDDAFYQCYRLNDLTLPQSLASIGNDAFGCCEALTPDQLPDSLSAIGDHTFADCELTEITLPDGITTIGNNPFTECLHLSRISVSPDHPTLEVIDGILYSKSDRRLVARPCALEQADCVIPQGTKSIGEYAFAYCRNLTSITIPDSVTAIGDRAFNECYRLTEIIVGRDSYAKQYCIDNDLPYACTDANDRLND